MLHVLILRIPARGQRGVHVTRVSIPRGMHRWACVACVGSRHLWPSGSHWGRMQPGSTAHQTRFHPGSGAIERVLGRAPVVRGIVERPRDGCVMRQGWILVLQWVRMLVAIAPVVIASRVPMLLSVGVDWYPVCDGGRRHMGAPHTG